MTSPNKAILLSAISALAMLSADPSFAQGAPAADDSGEAGEEEVNEIVVLAERLRNQVDTAQPPILVLDEEEIAAYGAGSIAELIEQLAPQTGSGRGRGDGRPVFLVNGMRVSSFREMRSYPPESIRRVEILPEETALKYGFSADQRVVNFILKDNYSSKEIELEYRQPDRGGYSFKEAEATLLRIDGPSRLNLNAEINDTTMLTEAERGVAQTSGSISDLAADPNPAAYRSLVADSTDVEVTANWSTKLGDGGSSLSLNGTVERSDTRSLSGLNTVVLTDPGGNSLARTYGENDPLERRNRSTTYSLGGTLNAPLGDWQLTGTLNASRAESTSKIDRYADASALVAAAAAGDLAIDGELPDVASAGYDEAHSVNHSVDSLVTVMGSPFYLPAGAVSMTVDAGYGWTRLQSTDTRNPGLETRLTRGDLSTGVNLGIPIASRRDDVWSWLGDFNLNFSAGVNHLSDFGTLTNWTAGAVWGVTEKLSLQGSYIVRDAAPGLAQLGNPEVVNLNVPVYDLTNGETVLVTTTNGGNPALERQKQRDLRLAVMWELPFLERSNVMIEYFRNRSSDVASSFPLLTPAIEAAFPDRVTRDGGGRLIALDQRPITLAEQKSSRLKFGLNLSGRFGKASESQGNSNNIFAMARSAGGSGGSTSGSGEPVLAGSAAAGPMGNRGRFGQFRQQLCAADAAALPDISALPERMRGALLGADGQVDPKKLEELKMRVCNGDGPRMNVDPQRLAELREKLCSGGDTPDLTGLPEDALDRLRGPDGQIDQERLARMKTRVCSADGAGGDRSGRRSDDPGAPDGAPPPGMGFAPPPGGSPSGARGGGSGGGGGGRGPGGGMGMGPGPMGGGGDGRGRWSLNLSYTLELENEVMIAQGLPVLDLLDGDALSGGGVSRHTAQMEGGLFYRGMGLRLSGTYSGPSRVDGSGLPGSSDLHFGSLAKFDLRVFANLGQMESLVQKAPFLKGTRVSLRVDNLFDTRRKVTDQNGDVPISYQPFLLDPTGRYIGIEFRKLF